MCHQGAWRCIAVYDQHNISIGLIMSELRPELSPAKDDCDWFKEMPINQSTHFPGRTDYSVTVESLDKSLVVSKVGLTSVSYVCFRALLSGGDMAAPRREVLLFLVVALLVSCGAAPTVILYRVPEEQPPNTLIGSLAADQGLPHTGHLYKLEVGSPYLQVDDKTGYIYTTDIPIDREMLKDCRNCQKCFLEFKVSITDTVKGISTGPRMIDGRIEVLDINDNTPQFSSPNLMLSISENTHIGAVFYIPLATDRDSGANGVAEYTLTAGPDANQLFTLQVALDLDEKHPQLVIMGNLDREKKDSYDLNISVLDGGKPARASSALLRVTVTDQNDNTPKFERSHYEAKLLENSPLGHSILQVRGRGSVSTQKKQNKRKNM